MTPDILAALAPLADVFAELGVGFHVGGSVASSLRGVARTTLDVDIVADLELCHVRPFVAALEDAYYVSEHAVADAIRRRASFNVIHFETMLKVDVFVLGARAFDRETFARAQADSLDPGGPPSPVYRVCTAEDIVLHKLDWYRAGGQISERQWRDVLGVLRVQGDSLDQAYLDEWAQRLDLRDLLERALAEAAR